MENASKALIIAGAILLAIIIIGIGVYVVNQGRASIQSTNLDATAVEAYNTKFQAYEGKNVKGAQVKSLLDLVRASNVTSDDETLAPEITVTFGSTSAKTSTELGSLKNEIKNGSYYTVSMSSYDSSTGYVTGISIADAQ